MLIRYARKSVAYILIAFVLVVLTLMLANRIFETPNTVYVDENNPLQASILSTSDQILNIVEIILAVGGIAITVALGVATYLFQQSQKLEVVVKSAKRDARKSATQVIQLRKELEQTNQNNTKQIHDNLDDSARLRNEVFTLTERTENLLKELSDAHTHIQEDRKKIEKLSNRLEDMLSTTRTMMSLEHLLLQVSQTYSTDEINRDIATLTLINFTKEGQPHLIRIGSLWALGVIAENQKSELVEKIRVHLLGLSQTENELFIRREAERILTRLPDSAQPPTK